MIATSAPLVTSTPTALAQGSPPAFAQTARPKPNSSIGKAIPKVAARYRSTSPRPSPCSKAEILKAAQVIAIAEKIRNCENDAGNDWDRIVTSTTLSAITGAMNIHSRPVRWLTVVLSAKLPCRVLRRTRVIELVTSGFAAAPRAVWGALPDAFCARAKGSRDGATWLSDFAGTG